MNKKLLKVTSLGLVGIGAMIYNNNKNNKNYVKNMKGANEHILSIVEDYNGEKKILEQYSVYGNPRSSEDFNNLIVTLEREYSEGGYKRLKKYAEYSAYLDLNSLDYKELSTKNRWVLKYPSI